jgi:hypothetical protein
MEIKYLYLRVDLSEIMGDSIDIRKRLFCNRDGYFIGLDSSSIQSVLIIILDQGRLTQVRQNDNNKIPCQIFIIHGGKKYILILHFKK